MQAMDDYDTETCNEECQEMQFIIEQIDDSGKSNQYKVSEEFMNCPL